MMDGLRMILAAPFAMAAVALGAVASALAPPTPIPMSATEWLDSLRDDYHPEWDSCEWADCRHCWLRHPAGA